MDIIHLPLVSNDLRLYNELFQGIVVVRLRIRDMSQDKKHVRLIGRLQSATLDLTRQKIFIELSEYVHFERKKAAFCYKQIINKPLITEHDVLCKETYTDEFSFFEYNLPQKIFIDGLEDGTIILKNPHEEIIMSLTGKNVCAWHFILKKLGRE